jgi:hypothetical protein
MFPGHDMRSLEYAPSPGTTLEQSEDITTLLPSVVHYEQPGKTDGIGLQKRLRDTPLDVLEAATGLSRHTLVRARKGKRLHPRSLAILGRAALTGKK